MIKHPEIEIVGTPTELTSIKEKMQKFLPEYATQGGYYDKVKVERSLGYAKASIKRNGWGILFELDFETREWVPILQIHRGMAYEHIRKLLDTIQK